MKRLFYIFTFLFVALSAMAHNLGNGTYIYYDNTEYNWTTNKIFFMIGHGSYSEGYGMAKINNTNLYFVKMPSWNNYTEWAVFGGDEVWGGEGSSVTHRKGYCANSTKVGKENLWSYNLIHNDGTRDVDTWHGFLNKTYTLECALNENNADNVGTIGVKYYTFDGSESVTYKDESFSNASSLIYPALTTQIILTATPSEGYYFVKWSDGEVKNSRTATVKDAATYKAIFNKICDDAVLTEGDYYINATSIKVANNRDEKVITGKGTTLEGVYLVSISENSGYDRLILDDKEFKTSEIGTNRYYNGSEWLYCGVEETLELPAENIQPGLYGEITYTKEITNVDVWHWISLPFDVKISDIDIEGGEYGTAFIIEKYNTEVRSGWETNDTTNNSAWEYIESSETILPAGKGFILAVDNTNSSYELVFKSLNTLNVVEDTHNGNNENYAVEGNAINANWHLIGTGLYDVANGFRGVNYVAKPDATGFDYTYHYLNTEPGENDLFGDFDTSPLSVSELEPYTAFFVQHGGDYSFSKQPQTTPNNAPRRAQAEEVVDRYYVNIAGAADSSYTAIFLAEDGSDEYVVGQDFLHFGASGASLQLYTVQGEDPMAFNYLQRADQKVVLGGYVAEAGRYTISIAMNGKPASVVLTDSVTGAVIDLLQQNYEFDAERGKLDGRFGVTITYAPAEEGGDDTTTDLENGAMTNLMVVRTNGGVIVEGLTVGAGVVIYDVAGRCVNEFVATEAAATIALEKGIYLMSHNGETVKFVVNR